MAKTYLATITILSEDSGTPPSPPGIWGGANEPFPTPPIANVPGAPGYRPPGVPTHPIYYPPGIWGPTDPRPGWGLPGPQPPAGAHPEHPIYYPPGIWGPNDPRPGWGLPGDQPHPEHPIVIPPMPPEPPSDAHPEHPIVLPPEAESPPKNGRWVYTEKLGWVYIYVGGDKPRPLP